MNIYYEAAMRLEKGLELEKIPPENGAELAADLDLLGFFAYGFIVPQDLVEEHYAARLEGYQQCIDGKRPECDCALNSRGEAIDLERLLCSSMRDLLGTLGPPPIWEALILMQTIKDMPGLSREGALEFWGLIIIQTKILFGPGGKYEHFGEEHEIPIPSEIPEPTDEDGIGGWPKFIRRFISFN